MLLRLTFFVVVIAGPFFGATAALAETQISAPAFTSAPDDGRVHVAPALQLSVDLIAPFACDGTTRGALVLDAAAHLCICDAGWKIANTETLCEWSGGK